MLNEGVVRAAVRGWLAEDIGRGDRTTEAVVPRDALGKARLEAREAGVLAGLQVAQACFTEAGDGALKFVPELEDGARFDAGATLARIEGPLAPILTAERTALNILQRLSGIATLTATFVERCGEDGPRIVDTRKTTPGLRIFEKYAVRVGGGSNHRSGLDDGVLVKDNHIQAAGGVAVATERAVGGVHHGLKVEVEVTDLDGVGQAIEAGADAVLLDNMIPADVSAAVELARGRVLLEASGGISLANIADYAATGVDLISVGALTHSARALDISLEVDA